MIATPFRPCLLLLPGLLWLAGCSWPSTPPGGAPVVDRSLRQSIATAPAPASVPPGPAAPLPPAAPQVEVQPLPRQPPLVPQQTYTGPASDTLYSSSPPPPAEPPPDAAAPPVEAGSPEPAPDETADSAAPAQQVAMAPPAAAEPPPAPVSGNQAVVALLDDAAAQVGKRNWDRAAAALERALRIEPQNAGIWHDLAQIRLQQRQYEQAESLALKSNTLAGKDNFVIARNWRLVASARRARGDAAGADAAEAQAVALER